MSGSHWKDRFSEKQLEKKRLSDRINQRRTRQQSKRIIAELECRLRLLHEGEEASLINWIQQENALLRAKIRRYRCKMEEMFNQGKGCLQQDDASWEEFNMAITTQHSRQDMDTQDLSNTEVDVEAPQVAEPRCPQCLLDENSSLFVELGRVMGSAHMVDAQFTTNDILESIMLWKASLESLDNDVAAVFSHFALDQEPFNLTADEVKRQALSKYLWQDIMEDLLYGAEYAPRQLQPDDMIAEDQIPETLHQRRAIAYCTYESLRAWRKYFRSSLEYIAIFWAQYRYFLVQWLSMGELRLLTATAHRILDCHFSDLQQVIACPTVENFHKCPIWRRPIPQQFRQDHPGVIDLIIWPRMREKLLSNEQQYDLPSLCVPLVQSFELKGFQADAAVVVMLQSDAADLVLDPAFERAIHDVRNLVAISPPFADLYPELAEATVTDLAMPPSLPPPQYGHPRRRSYHHTGRKTAGPQRQEEGGSPDDAAADTSPNSSSHHQSELTYDSAFETAPDQSELSQGVWAERPRSREGMTDLSASQLLQDLSASSGDKFPRELPAIDPSAFPAFFSLDPDAHDWPSEMFNFDSIIPHP